MKNGKFILLCRAGKIYQISFLFIKFLCIFISVVTKHLKNIYESGELDAAATCANFAQVADNGMTAAIAKAFAESEFEQYRIIQDRLYQSDFDRLMAETDSGRG